MHSELVSDGVIVPNTQNLNSAIKEQDKLILKGVNVLNRLFIEEAQIQCHRRKILNITSPRRNASESIISPPA